MRLVDDDEVVVAPIEARADIDAVGPAALAGQVGMVKDIETKPVLFKRIERAVLAVEQPVVGELLRAEHERLLVLQLEVLDDGQGFKGLSQADAVGENAPQVA